MSEKQTIEVAACPVTVNHETTACVPVSVNTFAEPGDITVECGGTPVIHSGGDSCCGTPCSNYEFTVSQTMCINIPIAFGVDVAIGETYVSNGETTGDAGCGCSCNCGDALDSALDNTLDNILD